METAQTLLTILPILDCSMLENFLLIPVRNILASIYSYCLLSSHSLTPSSQITSLHVPAGSYQVPVRSPLLHDEFFVPLASVHRASAPAPDHLGGPPLNALEFYQCLLHARAWRTPLDVALQMQMHHFPGSSGHASINRCIHSPTFLSHILLIVFLFNTAALPLTFYLPTALLNIPGNPSTIG